jgi:hypothetical protein
MARAASLLYHLMPQTAMAVVCVENSGYILKQEQREKETCKARLAPFRTTLSSTLQRGHLTTTKVVAYEISLFPNNIRTFH